MPVPILKLNEIQVLAISCFGVVLGVWLKRKIPVLDRLNIPAAIVGGMVYALAALALRDRVLNLEMSTVLRDILMVAFFTTIGMSASLRLLRVGGLQVAYFFAIATLGAILQNAVGMGAAKLFSLNPLLGVVSGSVALTGGPATALAFGATFEQMGVAGATTLGLAAAAFGITAGGMLGGFIGGSLIRRHRLQSAARTGNPQPLTLETPAAVDGPQPVEEPSEEKSPLLRSVIAIAIAMGLGTILTSGFQRMGLILPAYVGAMIVAGAIRNLDDRFSFARISQPEVDSIGSISLSIFIVMALLTQLRLWELVHLALPLVAMLALQVALVWLMCVTIVYLAMGRDYESAVMSGGFCGFMLGTTANALACMDELRQKYGPAPRAFIVVPIVGAFLIDFTNAMIITAILNLFH
jgi:ESS family glutamate:Na+ symporter